MISTNKEKRKIQLNSRKEKQRGITMEPYCSKKVPLPEQRPWAELTPRQTAGDGGKVARRPVSRDCGHSEKGVTEF